jgi:DNA replication protein DnaC
VVRSLVQDSGWVQRHQHIFLVGPTGIGKTFLARAFGQKACRDGFTAYFVTAKWHAQIGDPTIADSILDRLVRAAHRIELQGESMRKKKPGQGDKTSDPNVTSSPKNQ